MHQAESVLWAINKTKTKCYIIKVQQFRNSKLSELNIIIFKIWGIPYLNNILNSTWKNIENGDSF